MKHLKIFTISLALFLWSASSAVLAQPALWLIEDEDTQIHLFGTMHVGADHQPWLTPELEQKIREADQIYAEISSEEMSPAVSSQMMFKYGMLPPGQKLTDHLSNETRQVFLSYLDRKSIPLQNLQTMRPWLIAQLLTLQEFAGLGYDIQKGGEMQITALAQKSGISVKGLETLEQQMLILSDASPKEQDLQLAATIKELQKIEEVMKELTGSWFAGDLPRLEKALLTSLGAVPGQADKLLYQRNHNWVSQIQEMLDQPGRIFVAVGAGHTVGAQGVPELLRKAGLKVVRLN